jgi:hypothetical protein
MTPPRFIPYEFSVLIDEERLPNKSLVTTAAHPDFPEELN